MVLVKLLDAGPYFRHAYERPPKQAEDDFGVKLFDERGYPVWERITDEWFLPYEPAYIMTDEDWMIEICRKYAKEHPDTSELTADNDYLVTLTLEKTAMTELLSQLK